MVDEKQTKKKDLRFSKSWFKYLNKFFMKNKDEFIFAWMNLEKNMLRDEWV